MKHNFEQRKQNRIKWANEQAEKNEKRSEDLSNRSHEMVKGIPMGQPILIGHHSEKRHRNLLNKSWNTLGAAVAAGEKAKYYAEKASTIENNTAISSDDPNALAALQTKLQQLEQFHTYMKTTNACLRKNDKAKYLTQPDATESKWHLELADGGYASYSLTNNNNRIKMTKQRIKELEREEQREVPDKIVKGVTIRENKEANRLQLIFPAKPSKEVQGQLKHYSFRYAPSEGASQRLLNNASRYAAQKFLQQYKEPE